MTGAEIDIGDPGNLPSYIGRFAKTVKPCPPAYPWPVYMLWLAGTAG